LYQVVVVQGMPVLEAAGRKTEPDKLRSTVKWYMRCRERGNRRSLMKPTIRIQEPNWTVAGEDGKQLHKSRLTFRDPLLSKREAGASIEDSVVRKIANKVLATQCEREYRGRCLNNHVDDAKLRCFRQAAGFLHDRQEKQRYSRQKRATTADRG
jgi:hypothetical protein